MIALVVLFAVTIPLVLSMMTSAESTRANMVTEEKAAALSDALRKYAENHNNTFPANLTALITDDGSGACSIDNAIASPTYKRLQGWCGPYMDQSILEAANDYKTDGWGVEFEYDSATGNLISWGPNRADENGGGDDITY